MSRKQLLVLAAVLAVVAVVSFAVRFLVIEPRDAAHLCATGAGPWWCAIRDPLVTLVFPWSGFGWVSLGLGVAGFALGCRKVAVAALLVGLPGLILYDAEMAAVGVVLALLVVSRAPASGVAPPEEGSSPSTPRRGCC